MIVPMMIDYLILKGSKMTHTTDRKWETNWQRSKDGPWKSRTWDTKEEAQEAAENWAKWGAWNANWQAEKPEQDNQPAWTARNGKMK